MAEGDALLIANAHRNLAGAVGLKYFAITHANDRLFVVWLCMAFLLAQ